MIVVPTMTMRNLMTSIVEASHGLCDELGNMHVCATISESQLRMAALVALNIATGEVIWPQDRKVVIRRQKVQQGIFSEE